MPYRRFHGKTGKIVEQRGNAFVIEVKDGHKVKHVITTRSHFKPNFYLRERIEKEQE
jgi:large subunit ribosomal protein L21e